MKPDQYVKLAISTEAEPCDAMVARLEVIRVLRALHAGMGMCTEAGEFQDALKRHIFYGANLDLTNLQEEIGDMLWYCALACAALGISMKDVMAKNIKKLAARYPKKFTGHDALLRNLGIEREILEGK